MNRYDLIAFDMDGTLLNSKNKVNESSQTAIAEAAEAGKIIVVCTGRTKAEITDYAETSLQKVRFFVCENGAVLYDAKTKEILSAEAINDTLVAQIIDMADGKDAMTVLASVGQNMVTRSEAEKMEYYHAERYKELEFRTGVICEDLIAEYRKVHFQVEKINIYSENTDIRDELLVQIRKLPVTVVYAEETGFEVGAFGMSKAKGLRNLCSRLDIPMERTIAVGDSDNDVEMLKAAGLSVAMGNAMDHVKALSKVMVADHDHDGCAEAIYNYLMKE